MQPDETTNLLLRCTVETLLGHVAHVERQREAYSDAMHEVVACHQRLLGIAHLAKLDGRAIDPAELIAHLTGQKEMAPCPSDSMNIR